MKIFERLFKKKEEVVAPPKPKKMDFSKYNMKFTIKSICMFEKLSGKSFFKLTDEDLPMLIYTTFYCSNDLDIKYETFLGIMQNEQIANWALSKYTDMLDVVKQFSKDVDATAASGETEATMTDMANSLIINYGVDPHYVMYEMNTWEIEEMYRVVETKIQSHYEEQRLWTFLQVLPQIDGKKVNKPEKLLPFPWEAEAKKKKVEEDLKNNEYAIKHTIGMNIDDIINNGKGRPNNNS